MNRVRARQVALVNWKGVFYERYRLAEHVTALEGVNAAGKTTVMIAVYVVLLPDMSRLRFTNVGESDTSSGDKGLYGRLGESNRPSYSVVEFELPRGQRLLAGVRLERKSEPIVELSTFVITDLPADVRLQDILLLGVGDKEHVPELPELQDSVARHGGRLESFRTPKDYFGALFDRGITPLRLGTDEERKRFNDMLRTSMTGGIGRSLTSEFRSFLLKEEGGLADVLNHMRDNLGACRRTRTEIEESRELEREIFGVYEAGDAMFAAALLASRERADELRRRVDEATRTLEEARGERAKVVAQLDSANEKRVDVGTQHMRVREQSNEATSWRTRVEQANRIAKALTKLAHDLGEVQQDLVAADGQRERDALRHRECEARLERAEDAFLRAARGLAELQAGLAEVHRRADAHRTVTRRLAEAASALRRPNLRGEDIDEVRLELRASLAELDARRSRTDATLATAEDHRSEHTLAMQALQTILDEAIDSASALTRARKVLAQLDALDRRAELVDALADELDQTKVKAERQARVFEQAKRLAQVEQPLQRAVDVHEAVRRVASEVRTAEDVERSERAAAHEQRRIHDTLIEQREQLEGQLARWRELDLIASRLETVLGSGLRSKDELDSASEILDEQRDKDQRRHERLMAEQNELQDQIRSLGQTGGAFRAELLAVRDLLGGELLAVHFDDVGIEQAGPLQARLGPLAEAIVVDDVHAAAKALRGSEREIDTVRLVDGGMVEALVQPGELAVESGDLIVEEGDCVRVTRVPTKPSFGRRARRRRIEELGRRGTALAVELAEVEMKLADLSTHRHETALLLSELSTLAFGDPSDSIEQNTQAQARVEKTGRRHGANAEAAKQSLLSLARMSAALEALQPEAYLLDEPDLSSRADYLTEQWREAIRARAELQRVAVARISLAEHVDVLRRAPLTDEELKALRVDLDELATERGVMFGADDALGYVANHREALAWADAERALSAQRDLVPDLKHQCEQAEAARAQARAQVNEAKQAFDQADERRRSLDGEHKALAAKHAQERRAFEALDVEDPSDRALERVVAKVDELSTRAKTLDARERELDSTIARLGERVEQRDKDIDEAQAYLTTQEREWKPSQESWERLRSKAASDDLLTPAIAARLLEDSIGSVNRSSRARTEGGRLEERLKAARGGQEILERVRTWLSGQEQTAGEGYLQAWIVVRDWLRRRLPAQIAEVDDPLEALQRLGQRLIALEQRLTQQENDLRGDSESVARGIEVHIRKAQLQVRKLNQELDGVHFGTIRGLSIRLQRDDRMEAVLRALKQGPEQSMLFDTSIPIEDALDTLFRRHGGRTGGQRLLDYREYVQLAVEVRRQSSNEWEHVNPSKLSTGEAIGVGAALMMVVLTAWERSSNLFRGKRSVGTLRFLFLDEANRLSHDNLEVLFDLCNNLDLQLLIAAPEVASARGCTTYRLVRRTNADGGEEEVVVSGRRALEDGADVGA